MIDGINWIGDKLGMGKEIIKPIKLSTGTASIDDGVLSESTLAIVNDKGPGNGPNGYYQELLQSPAVIYMRLKVKMYQFIFLKAGECTMVHKHMLCNNPSNT